MLPAKGLFTSTLQKSEGFRGGVKGEAVVA